MKSPLLTPSGKLQTGRPRRWAGALLALLAATDPAQAVVPPPTRVEHFYSSWTQEFDRTSSQGQTAAGVVTDSRGNVITLGNSPASDGTAQFYTVKYDGLDGHIIWSRIFGKTVGAGNLAPVGACTARAIAVDSNDNIIVAGGATLFDFTPSLHSSEDFATIKYDSHGAVVFANSYDGTNQGADEVQKVVVDKNNNVIVTGFAAGSGTSDDFVTIEYTPTGTTAWTNVYDRIFNQVHGSDTPADMAVDRNGNVFVTGSSDIGGTVSFLTIKIDSGGTFKFARTFTSPLPYYGASAVAVDVAGNAFVTGQYHDAQSNDGFYTVGYTSLGGSLGAAIYQSGFDDHAMGAQSISVDPFGDPIVTGAIAASNGTAQLVTIKYDGTNVASNNTRWVTIDNGLSTLNDNGLPVGDTFGRQVLTDGVGNVIVVGDSTNAAFDSDMYVVKYDGATGLKLYSHSFAGDFQGADVGVAGAVDAGGNITFVGTEERDFNHGGVAYNGIVTRKLHRIIVESGDLLTADPVTSAIRKVSLLTAPALADNGDLIGRISLLDGKTTLGALFMQQASGGTVLPVIQKDPAPGVPGYPLATFASFGEPVSEPGGEIAFTAKLAGVPATKASTLWTNLGGNLHLALQQGTMVPGVPGVNLVSITSISLRGTQLLATVKTSEPATSNTMLLSLDAGNIVTVLLRTGSTHPVSVNNRISYVKTLTVLTPAITSPGDGRWNGDAFSLAKALLGDGRTVIFKMAPGGPVTPLVFSEGDASVVAMSATWKTFGLPATGASGFAYSFLGTLNPMPGVTALNSTALVYTPTGAANTYSLLARQGDPTPASLGLTGISYATLTDPVTNSAGESAFLTTLKATTGSTTKVLATNNRALVFGAPGVLDLVARTGNKAPDSTGTLTTASFSSFVSVALPAGKPGTPIFVAKVAGAGVTAKNNLGVWGVDSSGFVRRLLKTGDQLGTQTVSNLTLLKAVPGAFATARSFNAKGSVVMLVNFTDLHTALLEIEIP